MSAPTSCFLYTQISTDSQLFVSILNSFQGELMPCLQSAQSLEGMNVSGSCRAHHCPDTLLHSGIARDAPV